MKFDRGSFLNACMSHNSSVDTLEDGRLDLLSQTSHLSSSSTPIRGEYGKSCFKSLYVSDIDKQKFVHLSFSIHHPLQDRTFEAQGFLSKQIKIISKPSKKKSSSKNNDCELIIC